MSGDQHPPSRLNRSAVFASFGTARLSAARLGSVQFGPIEHLAGEAIVAFVDGELRMTAHMRAAQHLAICPECAAEVEAQQQARLALQQAAQVSAPSDLLGTLSGIPTAISTLPPPFEQAHPEPPAPKRRPQRRKRWSL